LIVRSIFVYRRKRSHLGDGNFGDASLAGRITTPLRLALIANMQRLCQPISGT
jgi:hypothetical protein